MSNHSRLYEDVFHTKSGKVSVRSTEVFDLDVQLGFKDLDNLELLKTGKGDLHVTLTITPEEMDEVCNYWQSYVREKTSSVASKEVRLSSVDSTAEVLPAFKSKIEQDEEGQYILLPDELLEALGWHIGDMIEITVKDGALILTRVDAESEG